MEEWIKELYGDTKRKWEAAAKNDSGYAIFYSPTIQSPKIMVIGYNPGGITAI